MSVQQLQEAIAGCHANLLAYLKREGLRGVGTEEHRAYVTAIQTLERELDREEFIAWLNDQRDTLEASGQECEK